ncbi:hypothetical protein B0H14DRAFT_3427343 [Mycena olivaceomarginata]|nr:hypothetical protein B0H14DRAFT_3427343 [Mycena olivaceomarginata]
MHLLYPIHLQCLSYSSADDFDNQAHMAQPDDVRPSFEMDLADKNTENMRLEKANKASLVFTRAYAAAAAGINSDDDDDDDGQGEDVFQPASDEDTEHNGGDEGEDENKMSEKARGKRKASAQGGKAGKRAPIT